RVAASRSRGQVLRLPDLARSASRPRQTITTTLRRLRFLSGCGRRVGLGRRRVALRVGGRALLRRLAFAVALRGVGLGRRLILLAGGGEFPATPLELDRRRRHQFAHRPAALWTGVFEWIGKLLNLFEGVTALVTLVFVQRHKQSAAVGRQSRR